MSNLNIMDSNARTCIDLFNSAKTAKDELSLNSDWKSYEDYTNNIQNPVTDEENEPGSVTNVIFPIIASQVADLVDEPTSIMAVGEEPSDQFFAQDVEHILDWMIFQNRMFFKIERHEWRRLKFGSSVWKIFYNPSLGMVVIEPVSPVNFFPDPKIKEPWQLQEGEFVAHVVTTSIPYLKRVWGSKANGLRSMNDTDGISIFDGELNEEAQARTNNKARVIELWSIGAKNTLRRRVIGNEITLYDSKTDYTSKSTFYDHGKYPFEFTRCYPKEGRLWGMGDVELLKPTQDIINELDDQIRLNARLMGNIQVVVGLASGINIKKWTAKAGLKLPARDHTAWQAVHPPEIPDYIIARRLQAMSEAEIISGRPDVVEGRRSGVRAASAIMALQEAGNRRARHKKMALQESLSNCLYFCIDYLKEFFTEEQAWRILGRSAEAVQAPPSYLWFKGSNLKNVPRLVPDGSGGQLKVLLDKEGKTMTKDAKFDIRVSIGAGLPHNRTFLYNAVMDMVKEGIMTREEARIFLQDSMDWPVSNPTQPIGNNFGAGMMIPGGRAQVPGVAAPTQTNMETGIPEDLINALLAAGSQGGAY